MTVTLLLADDHVLFRDGLASLIDSHAGFEVVSSTGDGFSAVSLTRELKPDICIVDIGMPILNGIEVCRQVKKDCPRSAVLMVSMHSDAQFVVDSINAGASGYVLKDSAARELFSAMDSVLGGKLFISSGIDWNFLSTLLYKEKGTKRLISERESEVLQLIAEGFSSKDISERLFISIRTVENHRANIYRKTGLSNVADLTRYAIRNGISPLDH